MISLVEWERQIDDLIKSKNKDDGKKLRTAVDFAKKAHEGAYRKSTNEPYIVHPYEVCLVASTVTDDIDVLTAALLHDVVEDTEYTAEDIREVFGDRVTGFVADESEDKMENIPKAMSWIIRKEKFLEHLKKAPIESKTICMSDKISNLRSTAYSYELRGDDIWNDFHQKDPKRHAWYYRNIGSTIYDDFEGTEAFEEYNTLFTKIFGDRIRVYKSKNGDFKMEIDEIRFEGNVVYAQIKGRITSSNAEELFVGANTIVSEHPGCQIVFDLEELEMISSAGLRVFLRLKKAKVKFKLINVSSDVYEVFDITGFVQMFDIKKAYRKMSVDGCEIIGTGAKGNIYKLDEEMIIKVYHSPDSEDDIVRERDLSKQALILGVPTAIPFDIVSVGERLGSVFELVNAQSLIKVMVKEPERIDELSKEYGKVMREMNEIEYNASLKVELPKIKDEIKVWAQFAKDNLDVDLSSEIDAYVDSVREDMNILHGDGHPDNVMCTKDEMLFIDMDTLCVGDKRCDPAIVYTALVGYKIADPDNTFLPISTDVAKHVWDVYARAYLGTDDDDKVNELTEFSQKFAYLRLYRRGFRKESSKPFFSENMKRELIKVFGK